MYLTPTFSHLFDVPLYYLEPMRIVVILSLVHAEKYNSYILALTLPAFSYFISGHPFIFKAILISGELTLNIFVFNLLIKKLNGIFTAALLSILLSKAAYYLLKFIFISSELIKSGLISTPVIIQLILSVLLGYYVYRFLSNTGDNNIKEK